jgi:hypothetical protein
LKESTRGLFRVSFSYWKLHILHRKFTVEEIWLRGEHHTLKALHHKTEGCAVLVFLNFSNKNDS